MGRVFSEVRIILISSMTAPLANEEFEVENTPVHERHFSCWAWSLSDVFLAHMKR